MSHYVAVDCGKYDTKVCALTGKEIKRFKLRTKIGPGCFADDMLKKGTAIVQVNDGEPVMFGYGAQTEPVMETSKQTVTHRLATLASIAMALGEGEFQDVYVAIGMPLAIAGNAMTRIEYKDFILDTDGQTHTVQWKTESTGPVHQTVFTIAKRFVYPEGCGVLWMFPEKCMGSTAVIDIGNLNTNNIYAESLNPEDEMCFTGELGGKVLIAGLARALEAELGSRVAESMVAQALLKEGAERKLVSARGDRAVEEKSRAIIADYAMQHVQLIKQQCDVHHWPLDFANVVLVGGTAKLLQQELKEVFGDYIFVPDAPEYVNVQGFLRRMCATMDVDVDAVKGD